MLLSALGTGAILAASLDRPPQEPPRVDPAAVDTYLAQLSETMPPPVAATLARETPPPDPALVKRGARLDKVEPVLGAAFSAVR